MSNALYRRSFTTNPALHHSRRSNVRLSGAMQQRSSPTAALMLKTRHSTRRALLI